MQKKKIIVLFLLSLSLLSVSFSIIIIHFYELLDTFMYSNSGLTPEIVNTLTSTDRLFTVSGPNLESLDPDLIIIREVERDGPIYHVNLHNFSWDERFIATGIIVVLTLLVVRLYLPH